MFPEPLTIFGITIHLFGIFAALSILLGYLVTAVEMKRLRITTSILPDLAFAILIPAFVAARILFVLEHWNPYALNPIDILKFWQGGIVLYGGLLGGLAGGFLFCQRRRLSFAKLSDPVALGLCLGLAFSRLGCLAAGCCYGRPTSLPWGVTFSNPLALARPLHTPLHPTQIYDFLIGLGIFIFLLSRRERKFFQGELLLGYLILTSGARIFLESFRAESYVITPLLAFLIFAVSLGYHTRLQIKKRGAELMTKPVSKFIVLVLAAAFLAACGVIRTQAMARGHDIVASDVNKIQKGTTTEKEILHTFGPPSKWREMPDGGKEYFYEYTKSGGPRWDLLVSVGGGTTTKTLLIWFDKAGGVTDYAYKVS